MRDKKQAERFLGEMEGELARLESRKILEKELAEPINMEKEV